jgi:hypothetical protein
MKQIRRTAALAAVLAVVLTGVAAASGSLSGTYVTKVTTDGFLNGTYHMTFSPGHFVIHGPYALVGRGTYSISGSRITLHGPGKCATAGIYQFKVSGTSLTFRKISDSCPRAAVLTARALKKL